MLRPVTSYFSGVLATSLLNCALCAPLCLRTLTIIDTPLTRLRALPIINKCLRVFTLENFSFQFFTRTTLHGVTKTTIALPSQNHYFK